MITSVLVTAASAEYISDKSTSIFSQKDNIIREYQEAILSNHTSFTASEFSTNLTVSQIQETAVSALNEAGYEAYNINPQTFDDVESLLNTNLEEAGLCPEYSYIILIEGEEAASTVLPRSSVSSSFTHNYDGTTYTLRWMTIYASDDPNMNQSSSVDVLDTYSSSIIQNLIDTFISVSGAALHPVIEVVDTVAGIFGLSLTDLVRIREVSLTYHAATLWTRRYTQVWSDYDNEWLNGCCVEEVETQSQMDGWFYDEENNTNTRKYSDIEFVDLYSDRFDDMDWRKDYAVRGYLYSRTYFDVVGDVEYYYDDEVIITHESLH